MEMTDCNTYSNLDIHDDRVFNCSPNLENVEHTISSLDESALFNFAEFDDSPVNISFDESFLQQPQIIVSADSTFDSIISQSQIDDAQVGSLQLDLGGQENNTHQTQVDISLDNVLSEDVFNFDDIPDLTADDFSADLFSTDSECYLTDNCNGTSSSKSIVPSNADGYQMSEVGSDQYGLLKNQMCTATSGYDDVSQGEEEQASMASYMLQQQEAAFSSYQLNYEMFTSSFVEFVMQQPNPQCQTCQLMRRIVHSNGFQDTKLEVHCHEGQNFHAVLQTRTCNFGNEGRPHSLPQIVQLPRGNPEYIKHFLMQYSLLRAKEGFALRYDSVMVNTESGTEMSTISDPCFPGPLITPHSQTDFNCVQVFGKTALNPWNTTNSCNPPRSKTHKSSVAAQRERTGRLQLSDCAKYFHLPINEAAKQMEICPTVLKKICRRNGLTRWPHRKIKSIERIIATLKQSIGDGNENGNGEGAESIRNEIAMLKNQRAQLCAGYLPQS